MKEFRVEVEIDEDGNIVADTKGFHGPVCEKELDALFEGVEGILKSIKKHLCVVIPIQHVMAVAITNVPKKYLEKIVMIWL